MTRGPRRDGLRQNWRLHGTMPLLWDVDVNKLHKRWRRRAGEIVGMCENQFLTYESYAFANAFLSKVK
jgi:hypothetical protein